MKTPSEALAEIIAPLLAKEGLFLTADVDKYKAKLASGQMNAEDWLLAVEEVPAKEEKQ